MFVSGLIEKRKKENETKKNVMKCEHQHTNKGMYKY